MKDRLLTLGGALLALYVAAMLFMPATRPEPTLSRPTSTDTGAAGLAGLYRWLQHEDVPVLSLRRRYGALTGNQELAPTGNLLIVTLPLKYPARWSEIQQLRTWLHHGNSVLLLLALGNRPAWAVTQVDAAEPFALLHELAGVAIRHRDGGTETEAGTRHPRTPDTTMVQLYPQSDHPLLRGVEAVQTAATQPVADWTLAGINGTGLHLLRTGTNYALWQLRAGAGRLWIASYSGLFSNSLLDSADNARLMANLVALALQPGGTVIFDDMHQGLSSLYDPAAFFADPRLHNTLWFLLALWLLWVVGGSQRLAPPHRADDSPQRADLVRASGGFFARCLDQPTTGRELLRHFFNDLRRHFSLPTNGEPVWERLSHSPRVGRQDLNALRRFHARLNSGRGVDLAALHNLTLKIKKDLS